MTRVRVRGWWLLALLAAGLFAMPWPGGVVDAWYSRTVFPRLQAVVTPLSNLTAAAVIDAGLVIVGLFLVTVCVRVVRAGRNRGWGSGMWEGLRRVVRAAAILALVFLGLWGLNYRRVPLEVLLGDPGRAPAPSSTALIALAEDAARGAGLARGAPAPEAASYDAIAAQLEPAFQRALAALGMPRLAVAGRPKVSRILTPFFTAAGVNGMLNPFALESIVHPDLLPFERPMVLAHEWAHLAGFADEADASAVAWLACVTGSVDLAYSAHLFVVIETASVVPRADWLRIRASLAPGVLDDIAALAKRLERQQPAVRETAFRVYDGYLKSNRVDDGVRSYSRVLRVLLTPGMRQARKPG